MGLEHLGGEINRTVEPTDHRLGDMESERPSFSELPGLDHSAIEAEDISGWNADDSERVTAELPHLNESEATDHSGKVSDSLEHGSIEQYTDETDHSNEKRDVGNQYYSTYEERMKQTPREDSDRGEWSGERGESDFVPNDEEIKEILDQYGKESISYEDGIPDFSDVAESTVEIEDMTDNRADNFRQCDEKCAEQWNKEGYAGRTDWASRDVKEWRQENGYSWHERNDMKTCDLVPTKVNDYFGHLGGVSECRKRDMENGGRDFDE